MYSATLSAEGFIRSPRLDPRYERLAEALKSPMGHEHVWEIDMLETILKVEPLASAPLEIVKCIPCGLVQLHHNFEPSMLYGPTYGYRSGLNKSMVEHLRAKAAHLQKLCPLKPGDVVLDIGANDGTSLGFYPADVTRVATDLFSNGSLAATVVGPSPREMTRTQLDLG